MLEESRERGKVSGCAGWALIGGCGWSRVAPGGARGAGKHCPSVGRPSIKGPTKHPATTSPLTHIFSSAIGLLLAQQIIMKFLILALCVSVVFAKSFHRREEPVVAEATSTLAPKPADDAPVEPVVSSEETSSVRPTSASSEASAEIHREEAPAAVEPIVTEEPKPEHQEAKKIEKEEKLEEKAVLPPAQEAAETEKPAAQDAPVTEAPAPPAPQSSSAAPAEEAASTSTKRPSGKNVEDPETPAPAVEVTSAAAPAPASAAPESADAPKVAEEPSSTAQPKLEEKKESAEQPAQPEPASPKEEEQAEKQEPAADITTQQPSISTQA